MSTPTSQSPDSEEEDSLRTSDDPSVREEIEVRV